MGMGLLRPSVGRSGCYCDEGSPGRFACLSPLPALFRNIALAEEFVPDTRNSSTEALQTAVWGVGFVGRNVEISRTCSATQP